jgi:hypothetical protein
VTPASSGGAQDAREERGAPAEGDGSSVDEHPTTPGCGRKVVRYRALVTVIVTLEHEEASELIAAFSPLSTVSRQRSFTATNSPR